jgi:hypothetical protein
MTPLIRPRLDQQQAAGGSFPPRPEDLGMAVSRTPWLRWAMVVAALVVMISGCVGDSLGRPAASPVITSPGRAAPPPERATPRSPSPNGPLATSTTSAPVAVWQVGAHPLPRRPDGYAEVRPTPPPLIERRLPTKDNLAPPTDGHYRSRISPVPLAILARSTWQPDCPVAVDDLRYLTMSFWGFDDRAHTGEMIVNSTVATAVTKAFGELYARHFPIEAMQVTTPAELTVPPTGDGNNTSAFVCRPTRGQTTWSAHAYGLAVDLNPFCNPYINGNLVIPALASAYLDRTNHRPGMVLPGDRTVGAFAAIGWSWGGSWNVPKDWMHFTATGH